MYLKDKVPVDLRKGRRVKEGFLIASAKVARSGLQDYRGLELGPDDKGVVRDGMVTVYRPEEEVFAKDAMESYAHRPITIGHPPHLVSSRTWRKDQPAGHTEGDVVRDGEFVRVSLMVLDEAAAKALEDGAQFSMGYEMELDWTPGTTPDGQAYDARQTKLRMNHVAVVDQARGGPQLVIDAKEEKSGMAGTKSVSFDGVPIEVSDQAAAMFDALTKRIAAKDGEIATLTKERDDEKAAREKADAEKVVAEKALADAEVTSEKLDAMVADREAVRAAHKAITGRDADKALSTAEMKAAAVKHVLGDKAPSTAEGTGYAFDALVARSGADDPLRSTLRDGLNINDGNVGDPRAVLQGLGIAVKKEG